MTAPASAPFWPDFRAGAFIAPVASSWAAADGPMPMCVTRFAPEHFALSLFERSGIFLPDSARRSVPKRQAEFLAGRLCARAVLRCFGEGDHVVGVGGHREPLWPADVLGSITHSGRYAAAALCRAGEVAGLGIDIETVVDECTRASLLALVVTPAELALLRQAPTALTDDHLLTLVFSAKESFFKAAFAQVGEYFGFECLVLEQCDPSGRRLHFRCPVTLARGIPAGMKVVAEWDLLNDNTVLTRVILAR